MNKNELKIPDCIVVKHQQQLVKINANEISFIRSEDGYSAIYSGLKTYIADSPLKKIHDHLPYLVKINRGILVNWDFVKGLHIDKRELLIKGGEKLPISRRHFAEIKRRFKKGSEA